MSMRKHKTIPIFVSHMGCPNDCAFCNQRTITGHSTAVTPERAEQIISESLKTLQENTKVEIGFFGGSFTGIEESLQRSLLSIAQKYVKSGQVEGIRLSTRPDYINDRVMDTLKEFHVETVELGAQSMDNTVLAKNLRGHTAEDTVAAVEMIRNAGIRPGLQMMTGLKGDTDAICIETARKMIELSPACVRIYPTLVLKGTRLDAWYQSNEYAPQNLEDAVALCATLKTMFDDADIPVIRVGLMASDQVNPDCDVVAGPYHPAFGELVQSEIYFRKVREQVQGDAAVAVHPSSVSAFIGNKRKNINRFREMGYDIRFIQDKTVSPGDFQIMKQKGGITCG